jgi:hypothetical protein
VASALVERMKRKRARVTLGAGIALLAILFAVIMHREVAGAVTIFTVRGTNLRVYQSDSGGHPKTNITLAYRQEVLMLSI